MYVVLIVSPNVQLSEHRHRAVEGVPGSSVHTQRGAALLRHGDGAPPGGGVPAEPLLPPPQRDGAVPAGGHCLPGGAMGHSASAQVIDSCVFYSACTKYASFEGGNFFGNQ